MKSPASILALFLTIHALMPVNAQVTTLEKSWKGLRTQVVNFFYAGKLDSAGIYARKMVQLSRKMHNDSITVVSLGILGAVESDPAKTTQVLEEALSLTQRMKNVDMRIQILGTLIVHLHSIGDIKRSYSYTKEMFNIAQSTGLSDAWEQSYLNASQLYLLIGDTKKTIYHLKKLIEILNKGDKNEKYINLRLAESYMSLGSNYQELQRPDSALIYLKRGIKHAYQFNVQLALSRGYLGLCNYYIKEFEATGKYKSNIKIALDSAKVYLDPANYDQYGLYQKTLANYHLINGHYAESIQLADSLLKEAQKSQNLRNELLLRNILSSAYEKSGKYTLALQHLTEVAKVKESINQQEVDHQISIYEVDRQVYEKELKNAKLSKEKVLLSTRVKIMAVSGSVILILFFVVLYLGFQWRRLLKQNMSINGELSRLNSDLNLSNRRLEHLLHGVSHDILAKLDFVLSTGNILVKNNRSVSNLGMFYEKTMQTIGAAKNYCVDLLRSGWERDQAQSGPRLDANQVVNELLNQLSLELQETGVQVSSDHLPVNLPISKPDFTQVMHNLISNAIKFIPSGQGQSGQLAIEYKALPEAHLIGIKDNGPGVPDHLKESIFREGVSTDYGRGTGRGLDIVYSIMQEYGGNAWMEDNEWGGATFWVKFPRILN